MRSLARIPLPALLSRKHPPHFQAASAKDAPDPGRELADACARTRPKPMTYRSTSSFSRSILHHPPPSRGGLCGRHPLGEPRRLGFPVRPRRGCGRPGSFVVDSYAKTVQHPTGGVIGELRVHEGDHVLAGDVLIHLDETLAPAAFAIAAKGLDNLAARRARLEAERDDRDQISFPSDTSRPT